VSRLEALLEILITNSGQLPYTVGMATNVPTEKKGLEVKQFLRHYFIST